MNHTCGTRAEVKDSRYRNGLHYRRRHCPKCDVRFTTYEISEDDYKKIKAVIAASIELKESCNSLRGLGEIDIRFRE